jgi:hypothetical protein
VRLTQRERRHDRDSGQRRQPEQRSGPFAAAQNGERRGHRREEREDDTHMRRGGRLQGEGSQKRRGDDDPKGCEGQPPQLLCVRPPRSQDDERQTGQRSRRRGAAKGHEPGAEVPKRELRRGEGAREEEDAEAPENEAGEGGIL